MIAYKFLRPDGTSVFTRFRWPLPGDGGPGAWVDAPAAPCRSGIHVCRPGDLPYWVGQVLYEIEVDGPVVGQPTKAVAGRGRLVRRIDAWDAQARDDYTRMCADRAHALVHETGLTAWDTVIERSVPEGPALLGFVAARIAEEGYGVEAYQIERARQTAWLLQRLAVAQA